MSRRDGPATATRIVVASTVMLSFISFWRGAAIVLSDLASSAFYAGGIAEGALGRSRSEEHTSELQSRVDLVCRLLLEKKKKNQRQRNKNQSHLGVHSYAP